MSLLHESQVGARLAAALVNSDPGSSLEQVLRSHRIRDPALADGDIRGLDQWAHELRAAFSADGTDAQCAAINTLLELAAGKMTLTTHDGLAPHLHLFAEGEGVLDRVKAVTAGGLALFVGWTGADRMGVCARVVCSRVYIDESRGGRQRYCSARCGNTDAVARHRSGTM